MSRNVGLEDPPIGSPRWRPASPASEYEIAWQSARGESDAEGSWGAPNRAQNLRTRFTETGILVVPRKVEQAAWEWGYGLPESLRAAQAAPLFLHGNRAERNRGGIVESYLNDPRVLEQGFTLPAPPSSTGAEDTGRRDGEVFIIDMSLSGTLDPSFSSDGQVIDFRTPGGTAVLHYSQLRVTDAVGRNLAARMEGLAPCRPSRLALSTHLRANVYFARSRLSSSPLARRSASNPLDIC